jgi:hypothetical protein
MAEINNFFTDSTNIVNKINNEIDKAKDYIHICVSWINGSLFKTKLNSAVKRGVKVKVITDSSNQYLNGLDDQIEILKLGVKFDDGSNFYLHNKFTIIDGQTLIIGSYNWSYLGRSHLENLSIISLDVDEKTETYSNMIEDHDNQFHKLLSMNNNILKMQYQCKTYNTLVIDLIEETAYVLKYDDLEQYYTSGDTKYLSGANYISFSKYFNVSYNEDEEKIIDFKNNTYNELFAVYKSCQYITVSPKGEGGPGFIKLYSNIFQGFKAPDRLMLPPF